MKIDVHDAVIKTATVEIKTLTISGKQVTLAVFRQLIEESVLAFDADDQATVIGPMWGTVNYHPDCKRVYRPHVHVVWQQGDELRRSLVDLGSLRSTLDRFGRRASDAALEANRELAAAIEALPQLFIAV